MVFLIECARDEALTRHLVQDDVSPATGILGIPVGIVIRVRFQHPDQRGPFESG